MKYIIIFFKILFINNNLNALEISQSTTSPSLTSSIQSDSSLALKRGVSIQEMIQGAQSTLKGAILLNQHYQEILVAPQSSKERKAGPSKEERVREYSALWNTQPLETFDKTLALSSLDPKIRTQIQERKATFINQYYNNNLKYIDSDTALYADYDFILDKISTLADLPQQIECLKAFCACVTFSRQARLAIFLTDNTNNSAADNRPDLTTEYFEECILNNFKNLEASDLVDSLVKQGFEFTPYQQFSNSEPILDYNFSIFRVRRICNARAIEQGLAQMTQHFNCIESYIELQTKNQIQLEIEKVTQLQRVYADNYQKLCDCLGILKFPTNDIKRLYQSFEKMVPVCEAALCVFEFVSKEIANTAMGYQELINSEECRTAAALATQIRESEEEKKKQKRDQKAHKINERRKQIEDQLSANKNYIAQQNQRYEDLRREESNKINVLPVEDYLHTIRGYTQTIKTIHDDLSTPQKASKKDKKKTKGVASAAPSSSQASLVVDDVKISSELSTTPLPSSCDVSFTENIENVVAQMTAECNFEECLRLLKEIVLNYAQEEKGHMIHVKFISPITSRPIDIFMHKPHGSQLEKGLAAGWKKMLNDGLINAELKNR